MNNCIECIDCNFMFTTIKYIIGDISEEILNEYNHTLFDENHNCLKCSLNEGCYHIITQQNINDFRYDPNFITFIKNKKLKDISIKKLKDISIIIINNYCAKYQSFAIKNIIYKDNTKGIYIICDYKKMLLCLIEEWINCSCFINEPHKLIIYYKYALQLFLSKKLIDEDWINNKIKNINRTNYQTQLTTIYNDLRNELGYFMHL